MRFRNISRAKGLSDPKPYESWLVAQKVLTFEEPLKKVQHVERAARRLAGAYQQELSSAIIERYLNTRNLAANGQSFIAANCLNSVDRFMRFVAQEEIDRLQPLALADWKRKHKEFEGTTELEHGANPESKLGSSDSAWLAYMIDLGPLMLAACDPQVFSQDFLAYFVNECLSKISTLSPAASQDKLDRTGSSNADRASSLLKEMLVRHRSSLPGDFLPNYLVIVEGSTESILLPRFASCLGYNLAAQGAHMVVAGGANQVAKRYLYFKEVFKLPIIVVLDADAVDQTELLQNNLRERDRLHTLADGDIEDTLELQVFVDLLNGYVDSLPAAASDHSPIRVEDFSAPSIRKPILEKLWRERALGRFDKVGFARFVADELAPTRFPQGILSKDGQRLIETICRPQ
jgi:hypothetical protein